MSIIERRITTNPFDGNLGDYDIASYLFEVESYNDYTGDV